MSTVTVHLPARALTGRPRPQEADRRPARPEPASVEAEVRCGRAPRTRPARLTNRGRLVVAAVLLLMLGVVLSLVLPPAAAGGRGGSDGRTVVATRVTVHPGQTLWQIAATAVPDEDPRSTIARIKEMNGLSSSALAAGQILLVPVR